MKSVLFFLVIFSFCSSTIATTYTSITLDGTNDFESDEDLGTEASRTGHLTWDENNLYIGLTGNPLVGSNMNLWVVVDTDPQNPVTGGNGRTDQPTFDGGGATFPFTANIAYRFSWTVTEDPSVQDPAPGTKYTVSGGSWSSTSIPSGIKIIRKISSITELSIPRNQIGSNQIHILFYIATTNGGFNNAQWPTDNPGGSKPTLTDWFGYTLSSGVSPDDAIYKDLALPITLTSFDIINGYGYIKIEWVTSSEIENDAFLIERSLNNEKFVIIAEIPGLGNSCVRHHYSFEDVQIYADQTYYYRLADRDYNGNINYHLTVSVKALGDGKDIPQTVELYGNYPNPFNPFTNIKFGIPKTSKGKIPVQLTIFNLRGQKIRTLFDREFYPGTYEVTWNGKDNLGLAVSSGVYFYQIKAGNYYKTNKMILSR